MRQGIAERTERIVSSLRRLHTRVRSELESAEEPRDIQTPTMGRHEFKYLIRSERIGSIKALLETHLELDKYGAHRLRDSYTVRSIYFDSPTFRCYHEKLAGEKNRRKYRLRGYNSGDTPALFLECKQRRGETYTKRKTRLHEQEIEGLRGRVGLDASIDEPGSVLGQLLLSMDRWQFAPVSLVVYDRIAYVWPGQQDTVRVTFDRNLRAQLCPSIEELYSEDELVPLLYGWTILEVKFNEIVPPFLSRLINAHGLQRQACSKYALSIAQLLGENPTKKQGWNHVHVL